MLHPLPSVLPLASQQRHVPSGNAKAKLERICHRVVSCVASDFGLSPAVLSAPTRGTPRVAFARQVAMYLMHVGFAVSFDVIGGIFGRDRTTVSHACRVIEDSRDDIWLDCRLAALEVACRKGMGTASRKPEGCR